MSDGFDWSLSNVSGQFVIGQTITSTLVVGLQQRAFPFRVVAPTSTPTSSPTLTPTPAPTPTAPLNLIAGRLEVTQGVQDLNNSVRPVKDKRTCVRLYVRSTGGWYWAFARLRVRRGTQSVISR